MGYVANFNEWANDMYKKFKKYILNPTVILRYLTMKILQL